MAYFDHFAKSRGTVVGDWIVARTIERELRFLEPFLSKDLGSEILEIGPGHAEFAKRLCSAGYTNYDVVEPNEVLRADAARAGVRSTKSYLIPELSEKDESYNVIILRDVFEHLNDARDAQYFVAEARRVLKPGGMLYIVSPDLMDWKEDFYNCDFSHSNPTTVRRVHEMFLNERLSTTAYMYAYGCFDGAVGYSLSRIVKLLTFWTMGEDIEFKPYKLRLTFLRRFLIVGRKESV